MVRVRASVRPREGERACVCGCMRAPALDLAIVAKDRDRFVLELLWHGRL